MVCSIACQRYHISDCPHLRHGRPPRCSLVAFYRPNWSNQGQKEGREMFARCPKETSPWGYRKTFGCANATPKIFLPKSSWGFGGFFQEAPKRTPRTPSNPNLPLCCNALAKRLEHLEKSLQHGGQIPVFADDIADFVKRMAAYGDRDDFSFGATVFVLHDMNGAGVPMGVKKDFRICKCYPKNPFT